MFRTVLNLLKILQKLLLIRFGVLYCRVEEVLNVMKTSI